MSGQPAVVDLAKLDGGNGFAIHGSDRFEYSGIALSSGDIDGDGIDDIIVGASNNSIYGSGCGATYIIFGSTAGFAPDISLFDIDPHVGYAIYGTDEKYGSGDGLGTEDVNGDGFLDLIVAAPGAQHYFQGKAYVLFGTADGLPDYHTIPVLDGTNGFTISGYYGFGYLGLNTVAAGDVNGDGFDDILLTKYVGYGVPNAVAYVIFGHAGGFAPDLNVHNLDFTTGFTIRSTNHGNDDTDFGWSATACDINGDGLSDVMIGDLHDRRISVVFGHAGIMPVEVDARSLDGTNGFTIVDSSGANPAFAIASAGDVNGDGLEDLITGSDGAILFGSRDGFAATTDIAALPADRGLHIFRSIYSGPLACAGVGDVNGDGFSDFVTFGYGPPVLGASVVFGGPSLPNTIDLDNLDGTNGFAMANLRPWEYRGAIPEISHGDVNGDGFSDIIVSNFLGYNNNTGSGTTYVVFGVAPDHPIIRLGTVASQTLAGGAFADTLAGLAGDDELHGNGGDDTLIGGDGADILFGGAGGDVFVFDSVSDLDGDTVKDFVQGSDRLDLTGIGTLGFLGTAAFDLHPNEVRIAYAGADTLVQIDRNGDGLVDGSLRLSGHIVLDASSFLTQARPHLVSASPDNGSADVSLESNLVLTFDEAVFAGSGAIEIRKADGSLFESIDVADNTRVTVAGATVTIDPANALLPGTTYSVLIGGQTLLDANGTPFAGIVDPSVLSFSTEGQADVTAPSLTGSSPSADASAVAVSADLVLHFDEAVKAGQGTIQIRNAASFGTVLEDMTVFAVPLTDSSHLTISGDTVTVHWPDLLHTGQSYYVTIDPGVLTDLAGNAFAGISGPDTLDFTVAGTIDTTNPTLVAMTPGGGATGVSLNPTIVLTFSEAVHIIEPEFGDGMAIAIKPAIGDAQGLGPAIYLSLDDPGQVSVSGNHVTLTLPHALQPGTRYAVEVRAVFADASGNLSQFFGPGSGLEFTTAGVADTTSPTVVSITPGDGSTNVAVESNIVVTFSEDIALPARSFGMFEVETPQGRIIEAIAYYDTTQCRIVGSQLIIDPIRDLATGRTYNLVFTDGLSDLSGNPWKIPGIIITVPITTEAIDIGAHTFQGNHHDNHFAGAEGPDTFFLADGGDEKVFGNGGDDTFLMGASLTPADQIQGGAGIDTVFLDGDYGAGLTLASLTLRSIERINLGAGHDYALVADNATIATGAALLVDGSNLSAANALAFDDSAELDGTLAVLGGSGNDSFTLGKGIASVTAGKGDDRIAFGSGFSPDDAIDGGTGNDVLLLDGNYKAGLHLSPTTLKNVERIALGAGYSYALTFDDANIAASKLLTIDGSALGTGDTLLLDGSAEVDGRFNMTGGAGNDVLTGGAQGDTFDISLGGKDIVTGGAGDDTVRAGGSLTAVDKVDGGAGVDTLMLDGDYAGGITLGSSTLVDVEKIILANGHGYSITTSDATVAAGQILTVDGSHLGATDKLTFHGSSESDGAFAVTGGACGDMLVGGAGNDVFAGGNGKDILDLSSGGDDTASGGGGDDTFRMEGALTALDRIDGGLGRNVLDLDGDYSAGLTFAPATLVNVGRIRLHDGHDYALVTDDATVAAGQTLIVDGTSLGAGHSLGFDASAETDGQLNLTGGAGNDVLLGGGGADVITGGLGADRLGGGSGADTFIYKAVADSSGAGYDTLVGFDFASDRLDIIHTVRAVDATIAGSLSTASFDADLAGLANHLGKYHAALLTANGGDLTGETFLIVDANGVVGYQAGGDLVFHLESASNIAALAKTCFI